MRKLIEIDKRVYNKSGNYINVTISCLDSSSGVINNIRNELEKNLTNVITSYLIDECITEVVFKLKSILQNYYDVYFRVEKVIDGNNIILSFNNNKLDNYCSIYRNYKEISDFTLNYDLFSGLVIKSNNKLISGMDVDNISNMISRELSIIKKLKNVSLVAVDLDGKVLYEIYKLFYNEVPNFSDEIVKRKTNAMMGILDSYDISLGKGYKFLFDLNNNVYSTKLLELLEKLSFVNTNDIVDNLSLSKNVIGKIRFIGDEIRCFLNENNNDLNKLEQLLAFIYYDKHNMDNPSFKLPSIQKGKVFKVLKKIDEDIKKY